MAQEQVDTKEMKKDLEYLKKKVADLSSMVEDMEFSRRTEEAQKRVDSGEYESVDSENLEEEMKKW